MASPDIQQSEPILDVSQELAEKIRPYLAHPHRLTLRRLLSKYNFVDIAEAMEEVLELEESLLCFQMMAPGQAALVLSSLDDELQQACLQTVTPSRGSIILRLMSADDAVDLLQRLEDDVRRNLLDQMPFDTDTRNLHNLLMEDPDTAAGIMSTEYIKVGEDATVGDALRMVRRADERDFVYYCFLVDGANRLKGVVSLKNLVIHDDSVPLERIATRDVKSIMISFDQELVANVFRKYYNLLAMPVVDVNDTLRGIVTIDDIVDVIDEESTEDIYQSTGINLEEIDERNLLTGPVWGAVKARAPWLGVTLIGQFVIATIYSYFGGTVAQAIFASAFLPLLCGLSGNMGSQSVTIAVRELALDNIDHNNVWEKTFREMRISLIIGVGFGIMVAIASLLLYHHMELSILLGSCIIGFLLLSATLGILMPFVIQKVFNLDPAGIVGPFITTLMDLVIYSSYLYLVSLLLESLI